MLQRYLDAAHASNADVVVRVTGDCPLIDPALVDEVINSFKLQQVDYLANTLPSAYPDGLDTEVFTLAALERAALESQDPFDHEHVTPYLRRPALFKTAGITHAEDLSSMSRTVDEPADFEVVSNVFAHFASDIHFFWTQVLQL